jgi:hypothetical protein
MGTEKDFGVYADAVLAAEIAVAASRAALKAVLAAAAGVGGDFPAGVALATARDASAAALTTLVIATDVSVLSVNAAATD